MPPILRSKHDVNRPTPHESASSISPTLSTHILRLIGLYILSKTILLVIVALSPGPGYDTSTAIAFGGGPNGSAWSIENGLEELVLRLTRWDGIYFATNSAEGYQHEQRWAFSWAFTRVSSFFADVLPFSHASHPLAKHALAASLMSVAAHLGAVLLLYFLVDAFVPAKVARRREIAFNAAALHILSPAGVFLIAPYSEAAYALLSVGGFLVYAYSIQQRSKNALPYDAMLTASAGVLWGLACTIRGNGLLNGIVFAWDLLGMLFAFLLGDRTWRQLTRMLATTLAGLFIAAGFALPQYVAYLEYCLPSSTRPWCENPLPSIYDWVQTHYWDVGFLNYWTIPNAPLFLLAAPVLLLLLITGYAAVHHARSVLLAINGEEPPSLRNDSNYQTQRLIYVHVLERMAVPQLVLAVLAITNFHVQIINRISSGSPLWYIILAIAVHDRSPAMACGHSRAEHYFPFRHLGHGSISLIVRGFVVYAIVQAGLYSSFLPPA